MQVGDDALLTDVDLVLGRGFTAIVGPSGAGKSTLLRLLDRLDAPTTGTVRLDGVDLATLDPLALRRRVAMVFQRPIVFPGTVLDNLTMVGPPLDAEGAQEALARVGLRADVLDHDAATLSGGEAQRLAIARALRTEPEVVLADEPTASLDGESTAMIEQLLAELAGAGVTVVAVTHDPGQAKRLADRIVVLDAGRVRAVGSLAELEASADPSVRAALGGTR